MFYEESDYTQPLKWDDIFQSAEDFEAQLEELTDFDSAALMPYDELYYVLALKYYGSTTRYFDEYGFKFALIRELRITWPIYKEQKSLMEELIALTTEQIRKAAKTLRNLVENPNDPTSNPSEVPIPDLSTQQESLLQQSNELEAIKAKYIAVNKNYLTQLYKSVDQLFKVIVSEPETYWLYPEEA